MVRVKGPKCHQRGAAGGADGRLTSAIEWSLMIWCGLRIEGFGGCDDEADMRPMWNLHKGRLLPWWLETMPGLRPFAMYALGEIPLPKLIEQPTRHSDRWDGSVGTIWSARHYGGDWAFARHLRRLGIVDEAEYARFKKWQRLENTSYEFLTPAAEGLPTTPLAIPHIQVN